MKKILSTIIASIALLIYATNVYAEQNAQSLSMIEKFSNTFIKSSGTNIELDFCIISNQSSNKHVVSGDLYVFGQKFKLSTPIGQLLFDGKNMYSFKKADNEVTIEEKENNFITEIKDNLINQTKILAPENIVLGGVKYKSINIFPEAKSNSFFKANILFDSAENLKEITIYQKNGEEINLKIKNIKSNQNYSDSDFIFRKTDFSGAEIIDLR